MTPLGILVSLVLASLVYSQSRHVAAVVILATVCYLTQGQPLSVGGFHFTAMRFVLLAGLIRVLARGEAKQFKLDPIDRALIAYQCTLLVLSTLRVGTVEELIYRVGCLYDVFLAYFVFRCLLRQDQDFLAVLEKLGFVLVPCALLACFESFTRRNLFSVFGGVGEYSWIREGHVRIEGAFRCPITAGAFGATFALLYITRLFAGRKTKATYVGLLASLAMVFLARSSGPFLGLILGIVALCCWPIRRQMPLLLWGAVALLGMLQLVMKAPVWFLLDRVSQVVGGGGYHRAELIDQFVHHFNAWWLMGTTDTLNWFPYGLPDTGQTDLTNRFVMDGVYGGLIGIALSIRLLVRCFKRLAAERKGKGSSRDKAIWGISATLVGSIGILFSVTYFDQMEVVWWFLLASVASLKFRQTAGKPVEAVQTSGPPYRAPFPQPAKMGTAVAGSMPN